MTTPHYIENSADAIRFVRDRPWYPLDESHVYEVPVSALGTICMAYWATLEDTRFAGNVIDDETLRGRYFELCNREDDEAVQKEWGRFCDDLWAYVDGMGLERQATWFIELNDPTTIKARYWVLDGVEYLDAAHTMPKDEASR